MNANQNNNGPAEEEDDLMAMLEESTQDFKKKLKISEVY